MQTISESDWKVFRALHPLALERFCAGLLAEVEKLASTTDQRPLSGDVSTCQASRQGNGQHL
jgi:hypothetical protein